MGLHISKQYVMMQPSIAVQPAYKFQHLSKITARGMGTCLPHAAFSLLLFGEQQDILQFFMY